jgi:hypothetical protein
MTKMQQSEALSPGDSPVGVIMDLYEAELSFENKMQPSGAKPPTNSPPGFLRLPLEVRDMIYRMLLITPYCTEVAQNGWSLKFHLWPAILLINKQISAEALRILYHENDFVIFTVALFRLCVEHVPSFRRLNEEQVINPVLQATVETAVDMPENYYWGPRLMVTLITTIDDLQPITSALWNLERGRSPRRAMVNPHHGDLTLKLHFNAKSPALYEFLSNLVLKPWERINGFRGLALTSDIKEPMRKHLEKYILEGPFLDELEADLKYPSPWR